MIAFPATLRSRLILFALAVFVPMLGLVLHGAWEQRRWAAAKVESESLRVVELAAHEQEEFIESARQFLITLAQVPLIKDGATEYCNYFLSEVLSSHPAYSNLSYLWADGRVLCSAVAVPDMASLNLSGQPFFQRAMTTRQFAVGDHQISRVTGKSVVVLAYPQLTDDGQVDYIVAAALDLKWFNEFISRVTLPEEATLTIFSADGIILARRPEPEKWVGRAMPEAPLIRTVLQHKGERDLEAEGLDGVERLYTCRPLTGTVSIAGTACIGIPTAVAYSEVNHAVYRKLLWLGVAALLAMAVGWFIGDRFILRGARELIQATRGLSSGDLSARTGLRHDEGELGELAHSFDDMASALQQRDEERARAEASLRQALAEKAAVLDALQEKGRQLRALTVRLAEVEEKEKRRLSGELHDRVGQTLTALGLNLNVVAAMLPGDVTPAVRKRLADSLELLEETVSHVRDVMANLSPPVLEDYGLMAALRWYGERFAERSGLSLVVQAKEGMERLSVSRETALFRIAQEALNNVVRHAQAHKAIITMEEIDEGLVRLTIADDGAGFDPGALTAPSPAGQPQSSFHWGLAIMRERAEMVNARFHVESAPGEGTRVMVEIKR